MQHDAFDRFIIATDTPTGSGIMPLGILYTMAHLASLTDMTSEQAICAASGNNAATADELGDLRGALPEDLAELAHRGQLRCLTRTCV